MNESRRRDWAELARHANACVSMRLSPAQEIQRLTMLLAMVQEISAEIERKSDGRRAGKDTVSS